MLGERMVFVSGGTFRMGSDRHYPEEGPARAATVEGFWVDRTLVTNAQFQAFVQATGYLTSAERHLNSLVFTPPPHPVALDDWRRWWRLVLGANWRQPYGPDSSIDGLQNHPVVHVTLEDALAYARWVEVDLPTEAEWEFASRGGLDDAVYAWGEEFMPDGRIMANMWHGSFPHENTAPHGFDRTSPVGRFPPNGYGLYDMIGNVWEWTSDRYALRHAAAAKACCGTPGDAGIPSNVIKGGSHLCSPNYCRRYRPAARQAQSIDSSTSHIGFRCVERTSSLGTMGGGVHRPSSNASFGQ